MDDAMDDAMEDAMDGFVIDRAFAVNAMYMVYIYANIGYDDIPKLQLQVMKKDKKCSKFEPHQAVFVKIESGVDYCGEIFLNDGNSDQLIYLENHTLYLICLNAGEVTRKFDIPGRKIVDFYAVKNALKNWVYRRTTKQFISMLKNIRGK